MPGHPFYLSREWRTLRAQVLRLKPYCRICLLLGMRTLATDLDHIKPISQGGARLEPRNLQPLCGTHHRQKTKAQELNKSLLVFGPDGAPLELGRGGRGEEKSARSE